MGAEGRDPLDQSPEGSGSYARDPYAYHGRVEMRPFASSALKDNRIGDPCVREVPVYLPPGYDAPGQSLPVIFLLAGFTGRGHALLETHPWKRGVITRYDRALAAGEMPPAILVMPDCFTRFGGSQYLNSSLLGNYEDYVARELVDFVDESYCTHKGRRAVAGKSSGGFGAMHLAMRHPRTFPVAASISGDCHFEYGYASEFLSASRVLLEYDSDPALFLEKFLESPKLDGDNHAVINLIAMSACYSPNPQSPLGFDLPIDPATGARRPEVWERWLAYDPLFACESHSENLKSLELLHLEAGRRDEFHLQFALRLLSEKLRGLGVEHCHEEHEGGHFGLDDRYMLLLPRLIEALS